MADAFAIARALGGKPNGSGWSCCCPAHPDRKPSLSVTERVDKVLLFCHAGCSQTAVITALLELGLWGGDATQKSERVVETPKQRPPSSPLRSWDNALPAYPNCLVRTAYLHRNRGILLTDDEAKSLRFAPVLFHWPTKSNWPAMVALVARADGTAVTVHQTFLARDGAGKAALEKDRLFPSGASPFGAGVWFGAPNLEREFCVAEGVETLLSALRLCGLQAGCAALSAGGLKALILPAEARRVLIFSDHDPDGKGMSAARQSCWRWRGEGREVRVVKPDKVGEDANDILRRRLGL
jgi:hypothetical protein